jgi:L-asparaginase II
MVQIDSYVEVVRGSLPESRHRVNAAVVDASGRLRSRVGNAEQQTYFRSAAKPIQALPLVDDGAIDRFGLTLEELALACGSHSGAERHVRVAESLLRRAGLDGESLACGPHPPFDRFAQRELAEAGLEPVRLHNNCSGKHAGMLLLARAHGWDPLGYEQFGHPVQDRILAEVKRWTGLPEEAIGFGTDGCGVVCFSIPLYNMAFAYAQLAAEARRKHGGAAVVIEAMTTHPELVAGEGRLCTELMRCTEGRVFAKLGAEGVYCIGVPGAELGIALKVEDGAMRAVAPAALELLRQLDLISEDDLGALIEHAYPPVTNSCGDVVGQLRAQLHLVSGNA